MEIHKEMDKTPFKTIRNLYKIKRKLVNCTKTQNKGSLFSGKILQIPILGNIGFSSSITKSELGVSSLYFTEILTKNDKTKHRFYLKMWWTTGFFFIGWEVGIQIEILFHNAPDKPMHNEE